MNHPPRIYLIGPMGAGKSTVGRRLADALGLPFEDSDRYIVERTGVDIPTIFDIEGEAGFRKREHDAIRTLTEREELVLATGGGVVTTPANRDLLGARGIVVYLYTPVETQLARTGKDRNRPLLQTEDPRARLEALMVERDPLYRAIADIIIDTRGGTVKSVARRVLKALEEPAGQETQP
ncbi:shikimate kinase AroK [Alkalilimnicola ehrlichii MLHE-1]|uniref:Shikimate kinase n=1 Tax=Alkalilimnicola ehrlichii (strain ATCC BAA-1101 / DSM 17681 / MLHE-1) TaxID=187272 RepID=Q0A4Y6_ALKEH|nr:shikimate kinase AroK [Alkalilimnicola ehrlichii]ABI58101.1 shikimate kinase [Alkalilimnicola ehrlichii MLHE-1]